MHNKEKAARRWLTHTMSQNFNEEIDKAPKINEYAFVKVPKNKENKKKNKEENIEENALLIPIISESSGSESEKQQMLKENLIYDDTDVEVGFDDSFNLQGKS